MPDQPQNNPNIQPPYYFEEDTFSLIDVILVLARQLKVIIITPTILCILAIIYVVFYTSPVYESTAKIMSSSGGSTSQAAGIAAQFGIALPTDQPDQQWVYPEIIKSRSLARVMLKRKFDTNEFGSQKSLLQILTYGNEESQFGLDTLEIMAVNNFISMIDVSEDIATGIYTVILSASEPQFAFDLNATLLEELDANQQDYNKAKTSETKQFILGRIANTEIELEMAEETLKDFKDRNRRIENSPALQLEQQRLSREVAVLTGVYTTLKQQLETTKIEEVKKSDYVIVLDPPEIPLIRSKPNKKRIIILVGFLGISIGVIIGFIKEYIENMKPDEKKKVAQVKASFIKSISSIIPIMHTLEKIK